jgi:hypothetical protein
MTLRTDQADLVSDKLRSFFIPMQRARLRMAGLVSNHRSGRHKRRLSPAGESGHSKPMPIAFAVRQVRVTSEPGHRPGGRPLRRSADSASEGQAAATFIEAKAGIGPLRPKEPGTKR